MLIRDASGCIQTIKLKVREMPKRGSEMTRGAQGFVVRKAISHTSAAMFHSTFTGKAEHSAAPSVSWEIGGKGAKHSIIFATSFGPEVV